MSRGARSALAALSAVCCLLPSPVLGQSPAVLRQADVRIALTSANACDVTADLTIESKSRVEVIHRLQLFEGARAELGGVSGAGKQAGVPRLEGRTMVLGVALDPSASGPYTIRYRVTQPDEWSYRCPIWVPVTPTDGRIGAVRLQIDVPPGTVADTRIVSGVHLDTEPARHGDDRTRSCVRARAVPGSRARSGMVGASGSGHSYRHDRDRRARHWNRDLGLAGAGGCAGLGAITWDSAGASTGSSSQPPSG